MLAVLHILEPGKDGLQIRGSCPDEAVDPDNIWIGQQVCASIKMRRKTFSLELTVWDIHDEEGPKGVALRHIDLVARNSSHRYIQ